MGPPSNSGYDLPHSNFLAEPWKHGDVVWPFTIPSKKRRNIKELRENEEKQGSERKGEIVAPTGHARNANHFGNFPDSRLAREGGPESRLKVPEVFPYQGETGTTWDDL